MNKLTLAHDYFMKLVNSNEYGNVDDEELIGWSWEYADAMFAEAEKREKDDAAKKRAEIREMLNSNSTFIEREGQHFDDVNWQPDWLLAPEWAKWWAMDKDGDVQVPAPFEPKEGDYFYVICPTSFTGYTEVFAENQKNLECFAMFGAWRTEAEIKQVVAALRKLFKGATQ